MVITGIIILGIVVYAVWAIRKIYRNHKNGSCCGGSSCSGCSGKGYCGK
ncbi:MAG: FeoB-associated Cys-rich membrane protein [Lachnospiraceae bacterium]|nr:FeoB-associated Cys-rich membrane protein [Lachnospiraceae bacterium]